MGDASKSFAIALSNSDISKAGLSIGNAILSSSTRSASKLTGWALDRAGVVPTDLPKPMADWLRRRQQREGRAPNLHRGTQTYKSSVRLEEGPIFLEDENSGFLINSFVLDRVIEPPKSAAQTKSFDPNLHRRPLRYREDSEWETQELTHTLSHQQRQYQCPRAAVTSLPLDAGTKHNSQDSHSTFSSCSHEGSWSETEEEKREEEDEAYNSPPLSLSPPSSHSSTYASGAEPTTSTYA